MQIFKRILLLIAVIIIIAIVYNYVKIRLMAGFAAKNTVSSVFVANRTLAFTDTTDTNFSPVKFANNTINRDKKTATASAFGLSTRKAFYREGLGGVLALEKEDINRKYLVPKRGIPDTITSFPYGNAPQKDTIFTNVDYKKLEKTLEVLFDAENQTRAAVVVYKNQIITERYADGFNQDSKILGWSMAKSIVGTLFGVLEHQNKMNIFKKAPIEEWKTDERKDITIHNLLQMNSGLKWVEEYSSVTDVVKMLYLDSDMTKRQIEMPMVGKPNETWNYSSGTTNVLSGILRQQFKTHQEYLDFWYAELIDKIGMNSMLVETDLAGNYVGSSYAWATARDWSKLGLLYLHNGTWNGEKIFSKDWVTYATSPTPTSDGSYGAQIRLNAGGKYPNVPKSMYYFSGFQGQKVYVFPEQDLVVVRMGLKDNADVDLFLSEIIAAI
ncbi:MULTISPECIES: serine hydrolase domain-containing protein [unclassified Polaribacter]|uniref:serine hydrolase domain-containing protein n=1 Tax=unclassified Polaribacter TaxID=196858 RepID=UPI0011BE1F40|nr:MULTISPECIES: serine hydrolase [unclassified Polaribacter]TXD51796.1 serine hydrolase [Polaribacter sp. IC063]TXD59158.1 serine hydrolase [Polaribacter sp. IC066]